MRNPGAAMRLSIPKALSNMINQKVRPRYRVKNNMGVAISPAMQKAFFFFSRGRAMPLVFLRVSQIKITGII